jgi:WD40 repeat protein
VKTEVLATSDWSADNKRLFVGDNGGHLHVINPSRGTITRSKRVGTVPIYAVATNVVSGEIALGCRDGSVVILDGESLREVTKLRDSDGRIVTAVAWSPKADMVAAGMNHSGLMVWNVRNGASNATLLSEQGKSVPSMAEQDVHNLVLSLCFDSTGEHIVTAGSYGVAGVWKTRTMRKTVRPDLSDNMFSAAYSPDGRRLAAARQDGTLQIFDTDSKSRNFGKVVRSLALNRSCQGLRLDGAIGLDDALTDDKLTLRDYFSSLGAEAHLR